MSTNKDINLVVLLLRLGACSEAIAWAESLGPNHPADATAWEQCPRGDWMLWVAGRLGIPRATLVLGACACARQALVHIKAGEDRPRIAIETAESWARGGEGAASIEEVRKARAAADAAAAAAYAADAAADAAYAAYAAAAAAAARKKSLAKSAELVREVISWALLAVEVAKKLGE